MMLSDTPTCKACNEEAVIYCQDCKVFMCPTHLLQHKEFKLLFTSEHKIFEVKEFLMNANTNDIKKTDNDTKCTKHEKNRKFYCEDCFELICSSCFISHPKHTILLMEDYSEKQRVKLRNMSESLVLKSQEISDTIEERRNQIISIQKLIDNKSKELKDILERIDSINKISIETSNNELLDRERYQDLLDYVQHKYLRRIRGIH
jgi:hypothetical protein